MTPPPFRVRRTPPVLRRLMRENYRAERVDDGGFVACFQLG
ncbi:MAG: hypothetical protein ACRDQI_00575 [Pseudonocardiaceae bacterium]